MSKKVLVDMKTGTILKELKEGDKIVSKDQSEAYKQRLDYMSRENKSKWIACHHESIENINKELSLINAGAILKLIPYMSFNNDGILVIDDRYLKKSDIQNIIGRNEKTSRGIYKNLIELGVLIEYKDSNKTYIKVNEKYHTFGKINISNLKFTKIFIKKLKELSDILKLNELGLLYKVLPYFHYSQYYLVRNPNESDLNKLEFINRNELAALLEVTPQNIHILLSKMKKSKSLIVTESGRTVRYLIHPDLLYRDKIDTEWYNSVKKLIENH